MLSDVDAAWLAGLLEGEGCFLLESQPKRRTRIRVSVEMCDEDVIRKAVKLINSNVTTRQDPRKNHSRTWRVQWDGADAEFVMRTVFSYMGARRAAKIQECLSTPNLSHTPRIKND